MSLSKLSINSILAGNKLNLSNSFHRSGSYPINSSHNVRRPLDFYSFDSTRWDFYTKPFQSFVPWNWICKIHRIKTKSVGLTQHLPFDERQPVVLVLLGAEGQKRKWWSIISRNHFLKKSSSLFLSVMKPRLGQKRRLRPRALNCFYWIPVVCVMWVWMWARKSWQVHIYGTHVCLCTYAACLCPSWVCGCLYCRLNVGGVSSFTTQICLWASGFMDFVFVCSLPVYNVCLYLRTQCSVHLTRRGILEKWLVCLVRIARNTCECTE